MGFFSAKKTTYDPMSAYTPQQRQAIEALMSLASTGSGGGITLGQQYGGDLGYYNQTPGELASLQGLQGLVSGGDITGARDVYSRMANNKFNPDDPSSGYAAFSRALEKAGAESQDVLNREAARTGGVFGSGRGRDTASLQADLANQRGTFLASLFNQGENRAMQGAQGLQSLIGQQQDLFQQLASQSAIERLLKDQAAKEKYAEFQRTRGEELSRLGLMQDQWNSPMGSITTKSPSTFSQVAGPLASVAGGALGFFLGGPAGAAMGSQLGGAIGGAYSSSQGVNSGQSGGGMNLGSLFSLLGNGGFSSGNVAGTGLFGGKLGGMTQSEILGMDTRRFRSA